MERSARITIELTYEGDVNPKKMALLDIKNTDWKRFSPCAKRVRVTSIEQVTTPDNVDTKEN